MKKIVLLSIGLVLTCFLHAQIMISVSNPEADAVIKGNYDPSQYLPSTVINHPDSVLHNVVNGVSADSLITWLAHIDTYYNRNTGSDTVSETFGIGAVRRWLYGKFQQFSTENENRLIVSYMDFTKTICGMSAHRNVFAVLPGLDTTNKEIVFVEGHYDTRCEGVCDTQCYSPGMDDNGSGTVLVLELARIMSRYAFNRTIIFALPTGEDQGLYGAKAFANYFSQNGIVIRACLNNDVVGGIACGMTSSPPGCPYYNHIDSTHVRVFSFSSNNDTAANSIHKNLARYIRMQQEEDINPLLETPMDINLMIMEDRQGRSGDHVPFRGKGWPAVRFCSQNEHGDGTGTPPDRQHTSNDILGLDLTVPPDGVLDTFFVDPGYLSRNTISNGVNAGYLALAPPRPGPVFEPVSNGVMIQMAGIDTVYQHYRVGVRSAGSGTLYFDSIYEFSGTTAFQINSLTPGRTYFISVMNLENGVESLPSVEYTHTIVSTGQLPSLPGIDMMQNRPNPFDIQTQIAVNRPANNPAKASILFRDMNGRIIEQIMLPDAGGQNLVTFKNPGTSGGVYTYTLELDGVPVQTRKMVILK